MTTQTDEHKRLQEHVNNIADDITNGIELTSEDYQHILDETGQDEGDMMYASDYLSDCLDIQYIIGSDKSYLGARILVASGGPNIWINTKNGTIEGYWWGDSAFSSFEDSIGLDDYLSEMWECM